MNPSPNVLKMSTVSPDTSRVYNDLLLAADRGQVSALYLLDLTATFDTVDHELLLLRLERQFGLRYSVHICPVGHTESCTPVAPHLLCTSSARSHKAQSLAQYCSCCLVLVLVFAAGKRLFSVHHSNRRTVRNLRLRLLWTRRRKPNRSRKQLLYMSATTNKRGLNKLH